MLNRRCKEMSLSIVIPSYKRPERVLAKHLVSDPIICVAKSEEAAYREYNPDCEIVTHPDSVKGLPPKRNWMVQHFGELFMLDDDVYEFQPQFYEQEVSSCNILSPVKTRYIIERLWTISKMLGISLFGFSKSQRPMFFKPNKPYVLSERVTGCSYGVIKSKNTFWPDGLKLKEDFWISGYIKYTERMVLIDKRYAFKQKDTFVNPGGLSSIRNKDTELEAMLQIKRYFGDCVKIKRDNTNIKNVQQINITMTFPF